MIFMYMQTKSRLTKGLPSAGIPTLALSPHYVVKPPSAHAFAMVGRSSSSGNPARYVLRRQRFRQSTLLSVSRSRVCLDFNTACHCVSVGEKTNLSICVSEVSIPLSIVLECKWLHILSIIILFDY